MVKAVVCNEVTIFKKFVKIGDALAPIEPASFYGPGLFRAVKDRGKSGNQLLKKQRNLQF